MLLNKLLLKRPLESLLRRRLNDWQKKPLKLSVLQPRKRPLVSLLRRLQPKLSASGLSKRAKHKD